MEERKALVVDENGGDAATSSLFARARIIFLFFACVGTARMLVSVIGDRVQVPKGEQRRVNHTLSALEKAALQADPNTLGFLHLPKCGGTSMWDFLVKEARSHGLNAYTVDDENNRTIWGAASQAERNATDVFGSNHINFHRLRNTWPGKAQRATYVTMLRDPRERLMSHYYFVKKNKNHHTYPFVVNRTFAEFVRDVQDGYYLHFFLPESRFNMPPPGTDGRELLQCCFNETDLEEVKLLLKERFAVVGILEDLPASMETLACKVPWVSYNHNHTMGHKMVTKHAVELPPFDEADMKRATHLDQQLYDYATQLLMDTHHECQIHGH